MRAEDGPRTRDRFDIMDGMDWSVRPQLVYVSKYIVATMDAQAVQAMGQVEDIDWLVTQSTHDTETTAMPPSFVDFAS